MLQNKTKLSDHKKVIYKMLTLNNSTNIKTKYYIKYPQITFHYYL